VSGWRDGAISDRRSTAEEAMSIRTTVISQMQEIAGVLKKTLPSLTDDLVLLDSGLDSLGFAVLVARLEETLGFDPFTDSDDLAYPVTLGDFIRFYEHAAESHGVDPSQAP
jgi:acyl carrier protein